MIALNFSTPSGPHTLVCYSVITRLLWFNHVLHHRYLPFPALLTSQNYSCKQLPTNSNLVIHPAFPTSIFPFFLPLQHHVKPASKGCINSTKTPPQLLNPNYTLFLDTYLAPILYSFPAYKYTFPTQLSFYWSQCTTEKYFPFLFHFHQHQYSKYICSVIYFFNHLELSQILFLYFMDFLSLVTNVLDYPSWSTLFFSYSFQKRLLYILENTWVSFSFIKW